MRLIVDGITSNVAMISRFDGPEEYLASNSSNTLLSFSSRGDDTLVVVNVKSILSTVAMVPHNPAIPNAPLTPGTRWFLGEQMTLGMFDMVQEILTDT
jgi:hypothetical protein